MALAVNGKYRHAELTREDLLAEFASWGLRRASTTVDDQLEALRSVIQQETPLDGAFPDLQEQLLGFATHLVGGDQ